MLHIRWNLMTRGVQNCKNNSDWSPVTFRVSIRRLQEILADKKSLTLSEGGSNINQKKIGIKTKIILFVGRKDFQMKNLIRKKSIFSTTPNLVLYMGSALCGRDLANLTD